MNLSRPLTQNLHSISGRTGGKHGDEQGIEGEARWRHRPQHQRLNDFQQLGATDDSGDQHPGCGRTKLQAQARRRAVTSGARANGLA